MSHRPTERAAAETTTEENEHSRRVRAMFGNIAARYDLLNHLLSANIDKRWRKLVARQLSAVLGDARARVLDVACGTGDLSLELATAGAARVTGLDFCRPMLQIAARKTAPGETTKAIPFIEGDALHLPFADGSFDAVTIAFGLRNLANFEAGLRELRRVLKTGGRCAILEFSQPIVPGFKSLFEFYFNQVLPRVGGLVSGSRGAYQYLPNSVRRFPDQRRLADLMRETGFDQVEYRNLTGGIAALHTGVRKDFGRTSEG